MRKQAVWRIHGGADDFTRVLVGLRTEHQKLVGAGSEVVHISVTYLPQPDDPLNPDPVACLTYEP